MEDRLKELFEKQKQLQLTLIEDNIYLNQSYINLNLLACYSELAEIQAESQWKNPDKVSFGWKKGQQFNIQNFKEEIIDLQHFIFNLALSVGMDSEEFYNLYINKNKLNHIRKQNGY